MFRLLFSTSKKDHYPADKTNIIFKLTVALPSPTHRSVRATLAMYSETAWQSSNRIIYGNAHIHHLDWEFVLNKQDNLKTFYIYQYATILELTLNVNAEVIINRNPYQRPPRLEFGAHLQTGKTSSGRSALYNILKSSSYLITLQQKHAGASDKRMTWNQANKLCQKMGATLPIINR